MTLDNAVTAVMGLIVLLSVVLIRVFGGGFVLLPVLVGIMAAQSAFTGFCPVAILLKKYNLVR
ncbi:MAG: rhodanese [Proteobacteria bacterium]|nr:MAG: rhodanese [Pseudomonadota bacterium]